MRINKCFLVAMAVLSCWLGIAHAAPFTERSDAEITGIWRFTHPMYLNGIKYTWPSSETASYYLKTDGSGTLSWATVTGAGDNTLDDAYDEGGAGAGRTITADTGAVTINNTDADTAYLLSITPNPSSSSA